jgi:hypothetical protein
MLRAVAAMSSPLAAAVVRKADGRLVECFENRLTREVRPKIGMGLPLAERRTCHPHVRDRRSAEGSAGIARRGLNEQGLEGAGAPDTAVRDTVERNTAGQAEIVARPFPVQVAHLLDQNLLENSLKRARQILVERLDLRSRISRRASEELRQRVCVHARGIAEVKVPHVELVLSSGKHPHQ